MAEKKIVSVGTNSTFRHPLEQSVTKDLVFTIGSKKLQFNILLLL